MYFLPALFAVIRCAAAADEYLKWMHCCSSHSIHRHHHRHRRRRYALYTIAHFYLQCRPRWNHRWVNYFPNFGGRKREEEAEETLIPAKRKQTKWNEMKWIFKLRFMQFDVMHSPNVKGIIKNMLHYSIVKVDVAATSFTWRCYKCSSWIKIERTRKGNNHLPHRPNWVFDAWFSLSIPFLVVEYEKVKREADGSFADNSNTHAPPPHETRLQEIFANSRRTYK